MLPFRPAIALRIEDFRVRLTDRPGWVWGTTRVPQEGEEIFCAAGIGTVKELHGKTGDGSRLVQVTLADPKKRPYFAAASNVLLAPPGEHGAGGSATVSDHSLASTEPEVWVGEPRDRAFIR
jgi:hypothetical protein